MDKNIFAVDIGGSKLILAVATSSGEILDTYRVDYPGNCTIENVMENIKKGYEKLKSYDFSYCGVAIPGLCDHRDGSWLYSPFSGIENVPMAKLVSEIVNVPTFGDNDVNISALAEKYFGICKGVDDYLWITVSNGIGGGLVLDGKLYRGKNFTSGEIGHFIVEENSKRKCGCGKYGCLEALSSGASIGAIYSEITGEQMTAKEVAEKAKSGDKTATEVWQNAGHYIGKASSYAVNLLGLDTVVLGGGAAQNFDLLKDSAKKTLDEYVFTRANPNVEILHSSLGAYAALKGCAALVLEKINEKQ